MCLCLSFVWSEPTYKKEFVSYANYLEKDTLYVFAGFDGSYNPKRWSEILAFAKENGVKFTFFISGVYLIPSAEKNTYKNPVNPAQTGVSGIGFGGTAEEVAIRKNWIRQAITDGQDIQSHLNCHIPGYNWSTVSWALEIEQFDAIVATIPIPQTQHIRFPNLVQNDNAYLAMAQYGYRSIIGVVQSEWKGFNKITFDYQNKPYTIIEFPIPRVSKGILMDWNINEYDRLHHISSAQAEEYTYKAYMQEAALCLAENRPLFISHHFTWMNNGAYWRAMQRVLVDLKAKYKIKYVTISDIYNLVNK